MTEQSILIGNQSIPVYSVNSLIIGSGAASLNASVCIYENGIHDMLIVTDHWGGGTSNNSGSDKQTYYRTAATGMIPDCSYEMAKDLYSGGCMHGDIALCEANHSLQAFMNLVKLGVPFPHNTYGNFVGYKTDHDPRERGTSAGPLTSHLMFKVLEKRVFELEIPILDDYFLVSLLVTEKNKACGAIFLNMDENRDVEYILVNANNVIMGTGGPGALYKSSVYPNGQIGAIGRALEIGAIAQNLTESQFGIASVKFRWNLSGSYQQVIPRYLSFDRDGNDPQEFLNPYFKNFKSLSKAIFLKGYQWPFDPAKIHSGGSSLIDLLVYQETEVKGRKVYIDYLNNSSLLTESFEDKELDPLVSEYLQKSNAMKQKPIERLLAMNKPAVDLYLSHDIDLKKEMLEIAVCAQHNNGGLKGNIWWESNVKHLFPIGELNGSHGVYRPGGSALNAGQVGGIRAAMYIANHYASEAMRLTEFELECGEKIQKVLSMSDQLKSADSTLIIEDEIKTLQARMSQYAGMVRSHSDVKKAIRETLEQYQYLMENAGSKNTNEMKLFFMLRDLLITALAYLMSIHEYIEKNGKSRGSYLICGSMPDDLSLLSPELVKPEDKVSQRILEIILNDDLSFKVNWEKIRPVPDQETWFEKVWEDYRNGNIS